MITGQNASGSTRQDRPSREPGGHFVFHLSPYALNLTKGLSRDAADRMSQVIDYQTGNAAAAFSAKGKEMMDPEDWRGFRQQAHRMLDEMVDYVENIRARPVRN